MRRLKQTNEHKPDDGIYGDCYRTCIAMLIGLEKPDYVPLFYSLKGNEQSEAARGWLNERGLTRFEILYPGETEIDAVTETMQALNSGIPYILSGKGQHGVNHSTVWIGDKCFCDPLTGEASPDPLVGPTDNGYWWIEILVKLPEPIVYGFDRSSGPDMTHIEITNLYGTIERHRIVKKDKDHGPDD